MSSREQLLRALAALKTPLTAKEGHIIDREGKTAATVRLVDKHDGAEALSNLLAAAPDLLAACKDILQQLESSSDSYAVSNLIYAIHLAENGDGT